MNKQYSHQSCVLKMIPVLFLRDPEEKKRVDDIQKGTLGLALRAEPDPEYYHPVLRHSRIGEEQRGIVVEHHFTRC